jgi:hypothetical protein
MDTKEIDALPCTIRIFFILKDTEIFWYKVEMVH